MLVGRAEDNDARFFRGALDYACASVCVCLCVVGVGGSESSIDRVRVTRSPESCRETKLLEML